MHPKKIAGILGIGFFIYLTSDGIAGVFYRLIFDLLLIGKVAPIFQFVTTHAITGVVFIVCTFWLINKISSIEFTNAKSVRKIFYFLIGAFGITQIIGLLYYTLQPLLYGHIYLEMKSVYFSGLDNEHFYIQAIIPSAITISKVCIVVVFVLNKLKITSTEDTILDENNP